MPDAVEAIDVLIMTREFVGVDENNKFVFACPTRNSKNPLRGYVCLSNILDDVPGIQKKELIKSTKLRKYNVAQILVSIFLNFLFLKRIFSKNIILLIIL